MSDIPEAWNSALSNLLEATIATGELSAKKYIVDHETEKPLIDMLIMNALIDRDEWRDRIRLHIRGLYVTQSDLAATCKQEIEKMFSILKEAYRNDQNEKVTVKQLGEQSGIDSNRVSVIAEFIAELGIFGKSTDMRDEDAYLLPLEVILDYENAEAILEQWVPTYLPDFDRPQKSPGWTLFPLNNDEYRKNNPVLYRTQRLQDFLERIENLARLRGKSWTVQAIPISKEKLTKLFFEHHPEIPPRSFKTLEPDFKNFGIKFQHGTSRRPDTEVRELLESQETHPFSDW